MPKRTNAEPVTLNNYDQRVLWYGTKIKQWGDNWPFLSHAIAATADKAAWDQYFREHLGGYPPSYRLFREERIKHYNVPEIEPSAFDTSYAAAAVLPLSPRPRQHEPGGTLAERERFAERVRSTLREVGFAFSDRQLGVLSSRAFRRFSDDDLRRIYPPKVEPQP